MSTKVSEKDLKYLILFYMSAAMEIRLQHLKNGHHMFVTVKEEKSFQKKIKSTQVLFLVPEELLKGGSSLKVNILEILYVNAFCTAQNKMRNRSWERSV